MLKKFMAVASIASVLAAQSVAPPAPGSPSLDNKKLEAYFRHLLMWPSAVAINIGEPKPSPLPGFYRINVHGTLGDKTQDQAFVVSADSQTVIRGDVFDISKNPFQATIDLLKTDGQPFLGIPGAPVTVVEFADFQCPYCKQESGVIRNQLMQAFPNDVQLFYMDYPIDSLHPFARGAAVLGRCIYVQNNDSFWAYHDWVFEHQSELTPANLREKGFEYAKGDKKLDIDRLTACASSQQPRDEVDGTVAIGDALKVSATPTLFINGRALVGTIALDDLKMVVEHEIAWSKEQKKSIDCCSVQLSLPGMEPASGGAAGKATVK